MPKVPVNIKLEVSTWQALELARGDINRTRFIELLLARNDGAWVAFDTAMGREPTPLAVAEPPVQVAPEPAAPVQADTPEPAPTPPAKRRRKTTAQPEPPKVEEEQEPPPPPTPKRPPRMQPVLTGRLRK